uniref:BPL/LPL catalytic domain-containing protein n=1 Tax=Ditylenchus dipsaci TaxID=166011 RepID=A0A915DEU9_9BILA
MQNSLVRSCAAAAVDVVKKALPLATIYLSKSTCIYENLAIEESIFRNHDLKKNGEAMLLWSNTPTVVIGRHQNPWLEANVKYCMENSIKIARRHSGGGAVYHDLGNLNISLLTTQYRHCRPRNLQLIAECLNQRFGVSCVVPNKRDDLLWESDGSKFSGTAARVAHGRAYHHLTILVDACLDVLQSSLSSVFKGKIQTNATRSTPAKSIAFLAEKVPSISVPKVQESVVQAFLKQFVEYEIVEWRRSESDSVQAEENQDYTSDFQENLRMLQTDDWIFGKTPKFELRIFDPTVDAYFDIVVDKDEIKESQHPEFIVGESFHGTIIKSRAIEDLRPSPLPFLQQKGDRFMLNQGVHFAGCRLRELSELMARDIDRCAREEIEHNPLMKPQDNINKHLHDESMLPDTLNFLSAASHLLANVEKKEQKAAAKRKSLIQLKKMRRVCKRFSVCENSDAVKQISVPVINPAKRNVYWWEIKVPSQFLNISPNGHCFYSSVALIIYQDKNQQSRVRKELMRFLNDYRKEKWTHWICPEDEVDDYIQLHQSTPSEISAERKHWDPPPS